MDEDSSNTHFGIIRRLIYSMDAFHLNILAAVCVVIFISWQFRSMFYIGKKKEQTQSGGTQISLKTRNSLQMNGSNRRVSSNDGAADKRRTEFIDREAGDSLDIVDEFDDILAAKEIPYHALSLSESEMQRRSQLFYESMKLRRSVRRFSTKAVPLKLVQNLIKTAGTAPSGANLQPWSFCIVASDSIKLRIREIVEEEEQINYARRMGAKWVLDVQHLNVNWNKPYLTEVPYLIVVMRHAYQLQPNGSRQPTYYNEISVSISVGILLAAIQNAGLVTVVTTPLNAGSQIRELLQRPVNEKVSLLLPLGYPAENVHVPEIKRKSVEDIIRIY